MGSATGASPNVDGWESCFWQFLAMDLLIPSVEGRMIGPGVEERALKLKPAVAPVLVSNVWPASVGQLLVLKRIRGWSPPLRTPQGLSYGLIFVLVSTRILSRHSLKSFLPGRGMLRLSASNGCLPATP